MSGPVQTPFVTISPTVDDFEVDAARKALKVITAAVHERGQCLIALSGGHTPCGVYRRLADLLATQSIDMSQVYLIPVDERMVPPEDSESNFGMIQREFISRVSVLPSHVYRIKGEADADSAASDYERELQTVFLFFGGRCDLIVLGVGEDGHTASLFPGTKVLHEMRRNVRAVFVPHLKAWRVTLTLRVINSARHLFFLAKGEQKAAIVGKIFASTQSREDLPATMVRPDSGTLTWMIDAEAASRIPSGRAFKSGMTVA